MFITFDYTCTNSTCAQYNKPHERLHKRDELQVCEACGTKLHKLAVAPSVPHVSWSTWRL